MIAVFHLSRRCPDEQRFEVMSAYQDTRMQLLTASLLVMGLYDCVAAVAVMDMDAAYRLTNNIDSSWADNSAVCAVGPNQRSTSMGDVLLTQDGHWHAVASAGFVDITETVLALVDQGGQRLREPGQPPVPYALVSQLFPMQRSALRLTGIPKEDSPKPYTELVQ